MTETTEQVFVTDPALVEMIVDSVTKDIEAVKELLKRKDFLVSPDQSIH